MSDKHREERILVPIDFSAFSEASVMMACKLANCMNIPITVLHVVHDPSELPGYYAKMTKNKNLVRIEDVAMEMMTEFMEMMTTNHPGLDCLAESEPMLVIGLPVGRILEVAENINAAMIVMGSQGRTGLKHIMLGSKAEQVVRLSPIAVTIVKETLRVADAPE